MILQPFLLWLGLLAPVAAVQDASPGRHPPRNLIVMIADGAGYNTWRATGMFAGHYDARQESEEGVHTQAGWIHVGKACWSLRPKLAPKSTEPDPTREYDPDRAWDRSVVESPAGQAHPDHFAGYRWLKRSAPDSAATMTHMMTGQKTYDSAINMDGMGEPLVSIAEHARTSGRGVGVVTSVPWSHATPACAAGAQNRSRGDYAGIARELLAEDVVDVLMGAGHPAFDAAGRPREATDSDYKFVGGRETWELLVTRQHPSGWTLIDQRGEFESLAASGHLLDGRVPRRLVGVAPVAQTLQQLRPGVRDAAPFEVERTPSVPDLATMALGALRLLDQLPGREGFFLMVEGGAVDWAMHSNQLGRMIEEMLDFHAAVEAVVAWIEAHGGWEQNLLLLTADHDHLLFGPESDRVAFQPLQDRGPGELPGHQWLWTSHSNQLVPVHARGAGVEVLRELATAVDPVRGPYVDDTDVFRVLTRALAGREGSDR